MVGSDIDGVELVLDSILAGRDVPDPIIVLSPSSAELEMLRRREIPTETYYRRHWDLSSGLVPPGPRRSLALACNVFMCSPDPLLWMQNIARRAYVLIVQDLIRSRRGADDERAWEDGDVMRYQFVADGEMAMTRPFFEMSRLVTVGPRYFYPPSEVDFRKFVCAVDLGRLPK